MGILVLDIGTSSMRGIVYDEKGNGVYKKQMEHSPVYLSDTLVEQNPFEFRDEAITILSACAQWCKENMVEIQGIATTSQRSSVIPFGKGGEPVSNTIMWQDKRNVPICKRLEPMGERIFQLTGARINPVFSGTKMMWLKENQRELYDTSEKLAVIPDYIMHEMTGEWLTDATYASRSLLLNLRERDWDGELLEISGIDRKKLCRITEPGRISAVVSKTFSEKTGIPEGTPVISAGGDQQCAALGMGVYSQGSAMVSAGTGAYIIAASERVPEGLKPDVICNASAIPGQYILESSILTCCSVFDWVLRLCYGMNDKNRKEVYGLVHQELSEGDGTDFGILLLPYFQGRGTPDWNSSARGSISGLTLGTSRADIARAALEGISCEISGNLDIIKAYTGSMEQIRLCGGLANSPDFRGILAAACGRDIRTFQDNEATAAGALISAAVALGQYEDYHQAFQSLRGSGETEDTSCCPKKAARMEHVKKKFQDMYDRIG